MKTAQPISLRWLIPALSAVILAIVVTIFGTIAYRGVRASTLARAAERLSTVVQVFSQPPQQSPAWIRASQTVANNPHVIDVARSAGQSVSDSARALVARLTPDTGQTVATDVRSMSGDVLFSVTSRVADSMAFGGSRTSDRAPTRSMTDTARAEERMLPHSVRLKRAYPDSATTSELFLRAGHVLYERAVPIRESGRVVGHVVEIRNLAISTAALRQLVNLIGRDAALVIGNSDGSLWSDFVKPVTHPPASNLPQRYQRDGRDWISATGPLPGVPWVVGVEFREDIVLAPVHALRSRLISIGVILLLLAVLVTERLSRRLTHPLSRLTTAAEAIAAGNRTTRGFVLDRSDEIGRLSRAFAAMADSIRDSHDTLENQIGERTGELRTALTRLNEAQDELVRKERLATLGQLSSGIAHELRNPLGVMTNALYYLEAVLIDAPPKVRDHLGKLRTQVRLSDSIITGLLSYTRSGPAQVSTANVEQLIEDQLLRVTVPSSIRVERDLPADLPDLRVDPVQIAQVLMNLFSNSLQAMEGTSGVLSVRARKIGDRVRIEVADTGHGIAVENEEKVFEPLFTTKTRGIGLGLAVSRSLARANEGELTVVRRSGRGAVLALELPIVSDVPATKEDDGSLVDGAAEGVK